MNERLKTLFTDWIGYLAVAMASIVYVLSGLFVPGLTGKSVATILAEGALGFILGMAITCNMKLQGILKGKRSEELRATKELHAKTVQDISGEIDGLELWCADQNAQKLREVRTQILTVVGLRYADYFDEDGLAKTNKSPLSKEQSRALRKARGAKISRLSTSVLTCDGEDAEDPFDFGETPAQYQRRTNITDGFTKLLTAGIFGYFGVDTVENFDLSSLVWRALFVVVLLALGVAKQMSAYLFVTDTYRGNIVKKINHLQIYKICAPEYARRSKKEEEYEHVSEFECVEQLRVAVEKPAYTGAKKHTERSGCELSKADEVSAFANEGVQHRDDRNGQDRGKQLAEQTTGAGGIGLRQANDRAGQLRAPGAGAPGRQGVRAPVERG